MDYEGMSAAALARQPLTSPVDHEATPTAQPRSEPIRAVEWTVIIPFLNEKDFICATLQSVADQQVPLELVLVDNGSTDRTAETAATECTRLGLDYSLVVEPQVGKVHALAAGLRKARTRFVATFDADTFYPPDYLSTASALLRKPNSVCAQSYYAGASGSIWTRLYPSAKLKAFTWLLPHQAHNGGAGQVFSTEALLTAGGFDPQRWDFALEDHEIIHRVGKLGAVRCHWAFWCAPDRHHDDRPSLRWTFIERLTYHLTPSRFSDWYFYRFLRPRLEKRRLCTPAIGDQDFATRAR